MSHSEPSHVVPAHSPVWHLYIPKLVTTLRQGYSLNDLRHDVVAGLTVAVVALPLAMALAIASGATPDKGLLTAVVAGFLISALGGSRFQIGGPTGAFVVVVFNVIHLHGYDGLILATLMAGAMLIVAGAFGLGTWIKYIPSPVITGFTSGIAVIIFSSQIKDFFGLEISAVPVEFFEKWLVFWQAKDSTSLLAVGVGVGALATVIVLRRFWPKLPSFLIVLAGSSVLAALLNLPLDTIGSRFGTIPNTFPAPSLPDVSLGRIQLLLPSAFTIAFLAGIESLLSAIVADGMTGRRHRSNCELVAQGIANVASALFGGLPATGAIARTATNIKSGARSPVSGILHAVFVLLFMLVLAPLAVYVPLASLAAVLMIVAWNMSEAEKFRYLMRSQLGDRVVLLLTFALTVLVDLTAAIAVGVVLASILFMHRMAEVAAIQRGTSFIEEDIDDFNPKVLGDYTQRDELPAGVEVFQLRGPLFFGAAGRLNEMLDHIIQLPEVLIVRMREVPLIDTTGVSALREFVQRCKGHKITVIATGVQPQPRQIMKRMGFSEEIDGLCFADNFQQALALAKQLQTDMSLQRS